MRVSSFSSDVKANVGTRYFNVNKLARWTGAAANDSLPPLDPR
jgi:hypothetical protein